MSICLYSGLDQSDKSRKLEIEIDLQTDMIMNLLDFNDLFSGCSCTF